MAPVQVGAHSGCAAIFAPGSGIRPTSLPRTLIVGGIFLKDTKGVGMVTGFGMEIQRADCSMDL